MIAVSTDYLSIIKALPLDAMTIFRNIDWEEYKNIVKGLGHAPRIRMAYDRGTLQIMTTSPKHERIAAMFGWLMAAVGIALQQPIETIRSATLSNEKVKKGTEADDCFYIQNARKVVGKDIDLDVDPPPDLAVEVDITSPSLKKFPIYAALGVPELWRYKRNRVQFFQLVDGDYQEISASLALPFLTPEVIVEYVHLGIEEGQVAAMSAFADWVRTNKPTA